jgi:hypothetical protein
MRNLRLAHGLFAVLYVLALLPGCQALYRYRPVAVLVRDAETQKPIADAALHLCYPLTRDSLAPFDSSERTGADGIAHLRAAPYGDFGARVEASAAGYLSEEISLSADMIQHFEPAHPFEETRRRPAELVVDMYAEPHFAVELIVPVGYRGQIKCDIQVQEEAAIVPGQRCFRYEVRDGFVLVKGPRLLRRVYPSEYRARYADGTPLTGEPTLSKVGFRWLSGKNNEQYYFVGTQSEYDMQRRSLAVEEPPAKPRSADTPRKRGRGRP